MLALQEDAPDDFSSVSLPLPVSRLMLDAREQFEISRLTFSGGGPSLGSSNSGQQFDTLVRPGQSISEAIARTRPGGHILLYPGVYDEAVTATTSVTLHGQGSATIVSSGGDAVLATAGVKLGVHGLTLRCRMPLGREIPSPPAARGGSVVHSNRLIRWAREMPYAGVEAPLSSDVAPRRPTFLLVMLLHSPSPPPSVQPLPLAALEPD